MCIENKTTKCIYSIALSIKSVFIRRIKEINIFEIR